MIRCEGLVKIYKAEDVEVAALQGLDLSVDEGELTAIVGSSGSGKSTLLNILGGLDRPSAGKAVVGEWDLTKLDDKRRIEYKRSAVGFVWQQPARNLLPYLTALQNVELPMALVGRPNRAYALELLDRVGMAHRRHHRLAEMSGGEQQRVAVAIALANRPRLLLADEPTGALDSANAQRVLETFRRLHRETRCTILIVTHDRATAESVDRIVEIRDGMTSAEWLKRKETGAEEAARPHARYAALDRAGRLQIPRAMLEEMRVADKVALRFDGRAVIVEPPGEEEPA
ncbi:ABC transporter ATP-binding protein [Paenibacillus sp.]|uniref:ABC transporter ATP-binding protein n=1 Tax=Paenibacillus sp. TaxID=58172 RepID=UPI002D2C1BD9|nr:ABC transporter ATP-binding protein [Paenibacillus sp.]HZG84207.1 ABC transporter ATP-binding protein [Paenibacillus sp.]